MKWLQDLEVEVKSSWKFDKMRDAVNCSASPSPCCPLLNNGFATGPWRCRRSAARHNGKPTTSGCTTTLNPEPLIRKKPETLYTRMNRELQAKLEEERKQAQERVGAFEPGGDLEKFFRGQGFRVEGLGVWGLGFRVWG